MLRFWRICAWLAAFQGAVTEVLSESVTDEELQISYRCVDSETGQSYREAETWTEDCMECVCLKSGEISCNDGAIACPEIYCNVEQGYTEVWTTTSCCPQCYAPCTDTVTGHVYVEGESWQPDTCTTCQCKLDSSGVLVEVCAVVDCMEPPPYCLVVTHPDQCCPVCAEPCTDASTGVEYEVGDVWAISPCAECRCEWDEEQGGKVEVCEVTSCPDEVTNCLTHVIKTADECCPVCADTCMDNDGTKYDVGDAWTPEPCTSCTCSLTTDGAIQQSCVTEACAMLPCHTDHVMVSPDSCCPECPCTDPVTGQEYAIGDKFNGGDVCMECQCTEQGALCVSILCDIPDCRDVTVWGEGMKEATLEGECCSTCVPQCTDAAGVEYEVGQSWDMGPCVQCHCMEDQKYGKMDMCVAMTCTADESTCPLTFRHDPGQCCGTCVPSCTDAAGVEYGVGDTWMRDDCTKCICVLGEDGENTAECSTQECVKLQCETRLVTSPGVCCPVCAEPCTDLTGAVVALGEQWKVDDCTTCECTLSPEGEMMESCWALSCLELDCPTVHMPGQCCPECAQDECADVMCLMVACEFGSYIAPGQCCPTCMEMDCRSVRCAGVEGCDFGGYTPLGSCCPVCYEVDCTLVDCAQDLTCEGGEMVRHQGECCPSCVYHLFRESVEVSLFSIDDAAISSEVSGEGEVSVFSMDDAAGISDSSEVSGEGETSSGGEIEMSGGEIVDVGGGEISDTGESGEARDGSEEIGHAGGGDDDAVESSGSLAGEEPGVESEMNGEPTRPDSDGDDSYLDDGAGATSHCIILVAIATAVAVTTTTAAIV